MSAVRFFLINLSTFATWMAVSTLSPVIITTFKIILIDLFNFKGCDDHWG